MEENVEMEGHEKEKGRFKTIIYGISLILFVIRIYTNFRKIQINHLFTSSDFIRLRFNNRRN